MISDLNENSKKINITAKVIEKGESREVNTKFGPNKVANFVIEDETGNITLVLWGDQIDTINADDNIKIENGYITTWNGTMQLNVGKYGKLKVI